MTNRLKVFSLFFFLLLSCNKTERFAEFSDQRLVDILFDISLSNSIAENAPSEKRDSLRNIYLDQIAAIQRLDRSMIDSIIDYVHLDSERFLVIADSLDVKLSKALEEN